MLNMDNFGNREQQNMQTQSSMQSMQQMEFSPKQVLKNQAMMNFRPTLPLKMKSEFATTLFAISFVCGLLQPTANTEFILQVVIIVLIFSTIFGHYKVSINRGFRITFGFNILTDIIACIGYYIGIKLTGGLLDEIRAVLWLVILIAVEIISKAICTKRDREQMKVIKDVAKQSKKYEKKINRIFK